MNTIDKFLAKNGHLGWVNMEEELYDKDMAIETNATVYVWRHHKGWAEERELHRVIEEGVLVCTDIDGHYDFFPHYSFNNPTL